MRLLFVTWAGGGNSTPVLGLATRLQRRGHDVRVVSPDDSTARFAAVEIDYGVLARGSHDVLAEIERVRPDVVVVDFMMPAWLCDAEASGVRSVALVHTLYDRMAAGLLTAFTTLEAINAGRQEVGLDALTTAPELLDRMDRVLVSSVRQLEDPSAEFGANVVHVGAILEELYDDETWSPPWTNDRPMVVVSLGTTPGLGDELVLARLFDAVANLPVNVLVNAGAHLDADALRPLGNVVVTGYVRHAAVMPHASVVVTHAGLGVTLAALCHGLPMVAIPLGRDQPHNAERIAAIGAGVALAPDATVDDLRRAIESVLDDSSFRAAARRFAGQYDPTASVALDELERVATR